MPDRAAGEAIDHPDPEIFCGMSGRHHMLLCAFAYALRLAVTPDVGREDRFVTIVNIVADRLANQVVADRPGFQAMPGEDFVPRVAIGLVLGTSADIKMIPPAGKLESIETEARCLSG